MERLTSTPSADSQSAECNITAHYQTSRKPPRTWTCTATFPMLLWCRHSIEKAESSCFFLRPPRPSLTKPSVNITVPHHTVGAPSFAAHISVSRTRPSAPQRVGLQSPNPHIHSLHKMWVPHPLRPTCPSYTHNGSRRKGWVT